MSDVVSYDQLRKHEIPGRVAITMGNEGMARITVTASRASAELYLHGAHVTGFHKNGEPPLLFLSQSSWFSANKPIRGGVPIIFPWFGPREGMPAHGYARTTEWKLTSVAAEPAGGATLRLELPRKPTEPGAEFIVTVTDKLAMELIVTNTSAQSFTFENCLHTYFRIGDIDQVSVHGLKGIEYINKVGGSVRKLEAQDAIRISSEVDRVYVNTGGAVEIHDASMSRVIRVAKSGSASTVVWNPWIIKSKLMLDFGDDEYKGMVCVESGNVADNKITLAPGAKAGMKVLISSRPA